eukprot:tig00021535_g22222.t1
MSTESANFAAVDASSAAARALFGVRRAEAWIKVGSSRAIGTICAAGAVADGSGGAARFAVLVPMVRSHFASVIKGTSLSAGAQEEWTRLRVEVVEKMGAQLVPGGGYEAVGDMYLSPSGSTARDADGSMLLVVNYIPRPGPKIIVRIHHLEMPGHVSRGWLVEGRVLPAAPAPASAGVAPAPPALARTPPPAAPQLAIGGEVTVFGLFAFGAGDRVRGRSVSLFGAGSRSGSPLSIWAVVALDVGMEALRGGDSLDGEATDRKSEEVVGWIETSLAAELTAWNGGRPLHVSIHVYNICSGVDADMGHIRFAAVAIPRGEGETPVGEFVEGGPTLPKEAFFGPHPAHASCIRALRQRVAERNAPLAGVRRRAAAGAVDGKKLKEAAVRRAVPEDLPEGEDALLARLQLAMGDAAARALPRAALARRVACRSTCTDPRIPEAAAAVGVRFTAQHILQAAGRGVGGEYLEAMCAAAAPEELRALGARRDLAEGLRAALGRRGVALAGPSDRAAPVEPVVVRAPTAAEMAEAAQRSRQKKLEEKELHRARNEAKRAEREEASTSGRRSGRATRGRAQ